jgi:hypothetical protein
MGRVAQVSSAPCTKRKERVCAASLNHPFSHSFGMPGGLNRYAGQGHLHSIPCSGYQRHRRRARAVKPPNFSKSTYLTQSTLNIKLVKLAGLLLANCYTISIGIRN